MKLLRSIALLAVLLHAASVHALTILGADGSDGVLNITADTVIDLSQAVTANWDANNSANAGQGRLRREQMGCRFQILERHHCAVRLSPSRTTPAGHRWSG